MYRGYVDKGMIPGSWHTDTPAELAAHAEHHPDRQQTTLRPTFRVEGKGDTDEERGTGTREPVLNQRHVPAGPEDMLRPVGAAECLVTNASCA